MAAADLRAGYLELIRKLGAVRPTIFVFGGYAEDALIYGRTMRDHSDIDVMIRRRELEMRLPQFAALGFDHFDTYYELIPGKPQVLNVSATACTGVSIVCPTLTRLLLVDRRTRYACTTTLQIQPPASSSRVCMQTISPLMLYRIRAVAETAPLATAPSTTRTSARAQRYFVSGGCDGR